MTIYNSQRVNNDPLPWMNPEGERVSNKTRMGSVYYHSPGDAMRYKRHPHPKYDNNPNPVLEAFRKHGPGLFGGTEGWLQYAMHGTHVDRVPFTEAHLEHARRVLTKLINVYKETA